MKHLDTRWAHVRSALDAALSPDTSELVLAHLVQEADRNIAECNQVWGITGNSVERREAYGWAIVREAADLANTVDPEDLDFWRKDISGRLRWVEGWKDMGVS